MRPFCVRKKKVAVKQVEKLRGPVSIEANLNSATTRNDSNNKSKEKVMRKGTTVTTSNKNINKSKETSTTLKSKVLRDLILAKSFSSDKFNKARPQSSSSNQSSQDNKALKDKIKIYNVKPFNKSNYTSRDNSASSTKREPSNSSRFSNNSASPGLTNNNKAKISQLKKELITNDQIFLSIKDNQSKFQIQSNSLQEGNNYVKHTTNKEEIISQFDAFRNTIINKKGGNEILAAQNIPTNNVNKLTSVGGSKLNFTSKSSNINIKTNQSSETCNNSSHLITTNSNNRTIVNSPPTNTKTISDTKSHYNYLMSKDKALNPNFMGSIAAVSNSKQTISMNGYFSNTNTKAVTETFKGSNKDKSKSPIQVNTQKMTAHTSQPPTCLMQGINLAGNGTSNQAQHSTSSNNTGVGIGSRNNSNYTTAGIGQKNSKYVSVIDKVSTHNIERKNGSQTDKLIMTQTSNSVGKVSTVNINSLFNSLHMSSRIKSASTSDQERNMI